MESKSFCYWLQGVFELTPEVTQTGFSAAQVDLIKRHLDLVFLHEIDPSYSDDPKVQEKMNKVHAGKARPKRPPGMRC